MRVILTGFKHPNSSSVNIGSPSIIPDIVIVKLIKGICRSTKYGNIAVFTHVSTPTQSWYWGKLVVDETPGSNRRGFVIVIYLFIDRG